MSYFNQPWIVLFGGARREQTINLLIAEGLNIQAIVVPAQQSIKLSQSINNLNQKIISVIQVDKPDVEIILKKFSFCHILSIGFPYILPFKSISKEIIALNIHPTLLPKYRGPTTGFYVIKNNETVSGSTIHFLSEEIDSGPIVAQSYVDLGPFDTIRSMQRKIYATEPQLALEAIKLLDAGFEPLQQDDKLSSHYKKKRRPEDSQIDPSKSIKELFNEIRACDPEEFPAYFILHGEKIYIKLWRANKPVNEADQI